MHITTITQLNTKNMNNSVLRLILIFAIFNFSLVMSDSNQDSSQEKLCPKGGPKYLFYKLGLEGKILTICNLVQSIKKICDFFMFGICLSIGFGLLLNNCIKDLNKFCFM